MVSIATYYSSSPKNQQSKYIIKITYKIYIINRQSKITTMKSCIYLLISLHLIISITKADIDQQDLRGASFGIPKIMWAFWDDGYQSAGLFSKLCINNMRHYTRESGWDFRFMSLENVTDYLSHESLVKINYILNNPYIGFVRQTRADVYRYFLIYEHGGMWLDVNAFFVDDLKWFERIDRQIGVKNDIGKYAEFIGFSLQNAHDNKGKIYDQQLNKEIQLSPGLQNWCFLAIKKSLLVKELIDNIIYTLSKPKVIVYGEISSMGIDVAYSGQIQKPYLALSDLQFQVLLQSKQTQIDANLSNTDARYAVEYYKLWSIHSQASGLFVYDDADYSYWLKVSPPEGYKIFMYSTVDSFMEKNKAKIHFFKLTSGYYKEINSQILSLQKSLCQENSKAYPEGSILYEYLLKFGQAIPNINKILRLNKVLDNPEEKEKLCRVAKDENFPYRKVIWIYADEHFQSSILTKLCRHNIYYYAAQSQWEVRFISDGNVTELLSVQHKKMVKEIIKKGIDGQMRRQMLKLMVMYEQGGMLIEENSFLLKSLSWIDNIGDYVNVSNRLGGSPQFVGFGRREITNKKPHTVDKMSSSSALPFLDSRFFITKPRSLFLKDSIVYLYKAIEQNFHNNAIINSGIFHSLFLKLLQKKQAHDLNGSPLEYYKIWNMQIDVQVDLFSQIRLQGEDITAFQSPLLHKSEHTFIQQNGLNNAPFLKFKNSEYPLMPVFWYSLPQLICKGFTQNFHKESIINKYLFKFSGHLNIINDIKMVNYLGVNYLNTSCISSLKKLKNITQQQIQKTLQTISTKNKEIQIKYSKIIASVWQQRKRTSFIILGILAFLATLASIVQHYRKKKYPINMFSKSNRYISAPQQQNSELTGLK